MSETSSNYLKFENSLIQKQTDIDQLFYLKQEGKIHLQARQKIHILWQDMRKTDVYSKGMLQYNFFEYIFEKNKQLIYELLKIETAEQFFQVFDQNNDGYLNEDDQILILSTLKEKIYIIANKLREQKEYDLFRSLMVELRLIEQDINQFQNELRGKLYKKEKDQYENIGQEIIQDLYNTYYEEFQKFNKYKELQLENKRTKHQNERNQLELKIQQPNFKIKLKQKLIDYQLSEKLVIIDERVEEALDFRKELNEYEKREAFRIQKENFEKAEHERNNLKNKQIKEYQQLQIKLSEKENKLVLKLQKEHSQLAKKVNIHKQDINRIQGVCTLQALEKGVKQSELHRRKFNSSLQNSLIKQSKEMVYQKSLIHEKYQFDQEVNNYNEHVELEKNKQSKTVQRLKSLISNTNVTKFYIRDQEQQQIPINKYQQNVVPQDQHYKITNVLNSLNASDSYKLPSLSDLYNDQLQLKPFDEKKEQKYLLKVEKQKQKYIQTKLTLDK